MELFQIDAHGSLFIAPDIDDWQPIVAQQIHVIFDLDGDPDLGVPTVANQLIYIYFPFEDKDLPDLGKLHQLARLGASCIQQGYRVLSHCGMGHNRSALVAGLILTYLGLSGEQAVALLRRQRKGALYNKVFAAYLQALPSSAPGVTTAPSAGTEPS
jgi:protein-tyrosine phosphatase